MQLVIPVYDKYHHVLDIYLNTFKKMWKNCPFSIIIICGKKKYEPKNNIFPLEIKILGFERGWASNMISSLGFLDEIFMISFEDCFLIKKPKNKLIEKYWKIMRDDEKIGFFCLQPRWLKAKKRISKYYWQFLPGQEYAANFQMSFWRKSILRFILRDGQTAWESELKGTKKAWQLMREQSVKFLCVYEKYKPIDYILALKKGKWTKEAVKYGFI